MATVDPGPLLSVRDLAISYTTSEGTFTAVEGVEFDVHPGEVVAIVGSQAPASRPARRP